MKDPLFKLAALFAFVLMLACVSVSLAVAQEDLSIAKAHPREGAIFGGALGGAGLVGTHVGNGGYSGYIQIGGWVTHDFSLAFHFHGIVGPRVKYFPPPTKDASFSFLTFAARSDIYLVELAPAHNLYLVVAPGISEIGSYPQDITVNTSSRGRYEPSITAGLGLSLVRFKYVNVASEVLATQLLTGNDRFTVVGGYLTAWFRPDVGLVGADEEY